MEAIPICQIQANNFNAFLPVRHSHALMQNLLQILTAGHVKAPLGSLTAPDNALLYFEGNTSLTIQTTYGQLWAQVTCYEACYAPAKWTIMSTEKALSLLQEMLAENEIIYF